MEPTRLQRLLDELELQISSLQGGSGYTINSRMAEVLMDQLLEISENNPLIISLVEFLREFTLKRNVSGRSVQVALELVQQARHAFRDRKP